MSEKVLKEKVVFKNRYGEPITFLVRKRVTELKRKEVPVRLVSESVGLEALKEWCKENQDYFFKPHHKELIEWAEKEAKKQAGEKK